MCCDDQSRLGPKGRHARCMAIPALIVAVIGCFAIITHRLYGIFATGGAALGLVAPSLMLCDGARIKSFRLAACASFGSAALCSGGVAMLVYALTGISSFFERCLIELCQGPRWSFISESYVPGWQLAGCGSSCSHATICVITRDCTSEQDCMSNSRSIWHCNSLTQELLDVRQLAIFGARPLPRDERALRSLFRDFLTLSHAPNLFSPLSLAHATLMCTALVPTVANIGLQLYLGYACFRAVGEPPAQPSAVAPAAGRPAPGAELQTVPTAVAVGVPVSTAVPATAC